MNFFSQYLVIINGQIVANGENEENHNGSNVGNQIGHGTGEQNKNIMINTQNSMSNNVNQLTFKNKNKSLIDYTSFLNNDCSGEIIDFIQQKINITPAIKVQLSIVLSYIKVTEEEPAEIIFYFNSDFEKFTRTSPIDTTVRKMIATMLNRIDEFEGRGSGLTLHEIKKSELTVAKYSPFRGGSFKELPKSIQNKHAIINIRQEGEDCFVLCIKSYFLNKILMRNAGSNLTNKVKAAISKRCIRLSDPDKELIEQSITLNLNHMQGPVALDSIKDFIDNNPNISINVFGLNVDNQVVGPLFVTEEEKEDHINLLYLQDEESVDNGHFTWIKDLGRLVNRQLRGSRMTKVYICNKCLVILHSQEKLNAHKQGDCLKVVTRMPLENPVIEFKSITKQLHAPLVVYADFECALKPLDTCANNPDKYHTKRIELHEPTSFGYYIKCFDNSLDKYVTYRGVDCESKFVELLINDIKQIYQDRIFFKNVPMAPLSVDQLSSYTNALDCWICMKPLNGDKVRDHCHLTGKRMNEMLILSI